jgi:phytoene dehydrogenase-like protein
VDSEPDDAFDFYPCLIDGAPASIYVNLRFEDAPPPADADTRYAVTIQMTDRGPHGIGTAEEGDALNASEESVIARAEEAGLVYVGRTRSRGEWEMTFYGATGKNDRLRDAVAEHAATRTTDVTADYDPAWRYYRELLLPDTERKRWMDDRRMVDILREQGDDVTRPRRVDHRASFATETARDAFVEAAAHEGFTHEPKPTLRESSVERRFNAQVFRDDRIELDHIHDVVMTLVDAAATHGGVYDGWTAVPSRA